MNSQMTELLREKIEVKVDAGFDAEFWAKVAEIDQQNSAPVSSSGPESRPWWHIEWQWCAGLALTACLLVFVVFRTINLPNRDLIQSGFAEMMEQEELLDNYELLTTIEDIDELSNEEWEILLEEELDG